jgi:hypothetical protein
MTRNWPGAEEASTKEGEFFFVCYRFNEKNGCDRQLQGQGCKGPKGQVFVHACTFVKQSGEYCLRYHIKLQQT